jgi:hypothetical protein
MRLIILFLALTIGGGKAQGATMLVEPAADGSPALVSNCGSVGRCGRATGRRRRGFPGRMPLPDAAPIHNSSAPLAAPEHPPIFDAPRTFPESNVGHATSRLTCCRKSGIDGFVSLARALAVQHGLRHDAGA